jgi:photosystem II stability/assembly factor-like uncharacterized protein
VKANKVRWLVVALGLGLCCVGAEPSLAQLGRHDRQDSFARDKEGQTRRGAVAMQHTATLRLEGLGTSVHTVTAHPFRHSTLYAGTSKGLLVSEDAGQSWSEALPGPTAQAVFAVAVHPANDQVLFVGTRDGLWKTEDAGNQWSKVTVGLPDRHVTLAMAFCAYAPYHAYLGTARHGVFHSVDGGHSWVPASQGLPAAPGDGHIMPVRSLLVDPANGEVAYVGSEMAGVFKTTDGGQTWQAINSGLPQLITRRTYPPQLAVSLEDPSILYVAVGRAEHSHLVRTALYRSTDGGQSWHLVDLRFPANITVLAVEVDPTDASTVAVRSTQGDFRITSPIIPLGK